MVRTERPEKQGLYDPRNEHDSCGVGFVADLKGRRSHKIVLDALQVLLNLMHRGACGCEKTTGDGAGILIQTPDKFLRRECAELGFDLPPAGQYGTGIAFLPQIAAERDYVCKRFEEIVAEEGQAVLGWRDVPHDDSMIGESAAATKPYFRQIFIRRAPDVAEDLGFERKLYVIRKRMEHEIRASELRQRRFFHLPSLSFKTLVYKGMLTSEQLSQFFLDLKDPALESGLALVHSRFSTNTFPSWELAHPFRMIAHNGEINTLRGNINWMRTREALMESPLFGEDMKKIFPVLDAEGSDSAIFDNALELLVLGGRPVEHAVMMLIPEAWEKHEQMDQARKDFYHYHMCLMEPWDGPASIAFTDGRVFGAILDRNGLRPSRYLVTKDGLVVMASETGVLDIDPERVERKGRLQPGRIFLVDTVEGRIVGDEEVKERFSSAEPYGEWLAGNLVRLEDLPDAYPPPLPDHDIVLQRQMAHGYTHEDLRLLMKPMAVGGQEAIGSMGSDTPLAVLSNRARPVYDYFKQLFAQVTNPPLDAIREELVTSVLTTIGSEGNLLAPRPESCRHIELKSPVLTNEEFAKLKHVTHAHFRSVTLPMLYDPEQGGPGLERGMEELCRRAADAIRDGVNIVILSDRNISAKRAAIPALLATAGVHHHLIREGLRTRAGIVVESGSPREVHHFCLLLGYGASAINPYLALESLQDMIAEGLIAEVDRDKAVKNFVKAAIKGIVKVMSKMGISTVQSYRGAQIFEAVGLNREVVDKYFTWTATRIEGVGLDLIAAETRMRHRRAFPERKVKRPDLDFGGEYQWRRSGEFHLFNPETIAKLQHSVRSGSYKQFKEYSRAVDEQSQNLCTLRALFEFKPRDPVPLAEVEPAAEIVRRFATGAMSFGSISKEAHETLAIAMNRIGGRSNTGEGGEDEARFKPDPNGDLRRSSIKQVASGRFGVTSLYLTNADELQIKMAQGAKPGEGGQLPGRKVDPFIAKVRHSTPGVGLISPPPHHDIYSIEDLAQLIFDLKNSNPSARVSVKLVAEVGVGTVAAGVAKALADVVLISGFDGGTGASPQTSIKHAGIPWELGLAETQQTLVLQNLRDRIVVQADGQMKTGRDVVVAALLGAEEYGFATAALVAEGCIMMRVCHLNTCPVGIATQDPVLRARFTGKPEHVVNFFTFIAEEVRELMAELGFRTMDEMIGRSDLLEMKKALDHWKARGLDFSAIFHRPAVGPEVAIRRVTEQDHGIESVLDHQLIRHARPALDARKSVVRRVRIRNTDRTTGTMLGHEITKRCGAEGLPDDTIRFHFEGSAGQSFGAFTPKGMTLVLEGDANDYLGKGLSGARIVVYPPEDSTFVPEENIIVGNVVGYGATAGEIYVRGVAGERFCVRNSGALAVVEGVGDHGCEYMTGGAVVVLGPTGRNFAAGMSGGVAYVYDPGYAFKQRCNLEMVDLESVYEDEDKDALHGLISRHAEYTESTVAKAILAEWEASLPKFVKVMPIEYRRVLEAQKRTTGELKVREGQDY